MFKFVTMREEHLTDVLHWRTREDITRCLFTDLDQPSMEAQQRWFAKVQSDPTCHYWVIYAGARPIGTLFVTGYNPEHRRAEYGFYVGPPDMRKLGGFLPPLFYNYAFSQEGLNLRKLNFEAFVWHEAVVDLHLAHGARVIGVLHDHVFKHGKYHDVALFELTAAAWNKQTRWQPSKAEFES